MTNFSIVIPIYNEEKNIFNLTKEIFYHLEKYKDKFEVIIVNDSSTDESIKVISELKNIYPRYIRLINNNFNFGQSYSISKGIKSSSFDTIVTLDGDGQNNPKDIITLVNKYFENKEIFLIGGIRKNRKDNLIKIISSRVANFIRRIILNDNCIDTGCSLKIFDKKIFISFPMFDGIHRFLPALFKGYEKKTIFIDVDHRPRVHGYSKYGTFKRLFKGIRDLIIVAKIIKKFKSNCD